MSLSRREIFLMALEAGVIPRRVETPKAYFAHVETLTNAAYAAGAAAEREACALACERFGKTLDVDVGGNFAEEIRARNGGEK